MSQTEKINQMNRQKYTKLITLISILLIMSGCSKKVSINSSWTQQPIIINGYLDEWQDGLHYFEDDGVAAGLKNDADFLYIAIEAVDERTIRQIRGTGFTLWFDPKGKKKKVLGIKFPSDFQSRKQKHTDYGSYDNRDPLFAFPGQIIIIEPEKDKIIHADPNDEYGLRWEMNNSLGLFNFEFKIPLKRTYKTPFAVNAETNRTISIGLTNDLPQRKKRTGGMQQRRGSRGSQSGMGRSRGKGRGFQKQRNIERMEIWIKSQLASH